MVQPIAKQSASEKPCALERKYLFPDFKAHIIFWPLAIVGFTLDLWSKWALFKRLEAGESYNIIDGFLQLTRSQNPGAAWGIFYEKTTLLIAVSSIALIAIIIAFFLSGKQPRIVQAAMGLFAAGVSGNLYDRIFNNGHVRDFIDAYYRDFHWATFNVADSLLCVGVGLLIISTIFIEKPAQKHGQPQK